MIKDGTSGDEMVSSAYETNASPLERIIDSTIADATVRGLVQEYSPPPKGTHSAILYAMVISPDGLSENAKALYLVISMDGEPRYFDIIGVTFNYNSIDLWYVCLDINDGCFHIFSDEGDALSDNDESLIGIWVIFIVCSTIHKNRVPITCVIDRILDSCVIPRSAPTDIQPTTIQY